MNSTPIKLPPRPANPAARRRSNASNDAANAHSH
jgi:hypothetical protein